MQSIAPEQSCVMLRRGVRTRLDMDPAYERAAPRQSEPVTQRNIRVSPARDNGVLRNARLE